MELYKLIGVLTNNTRICIMETDMNSKMIVTGAKTSILKSDDYDDIMYCRVVKSMISDDTFVIFIDRN